LFERKHKREGEYNVRFGGKLVIPYSPNSFLKCFIKIINYTNFEIPTQKQLIE